MDVCPEAQPSHLKKRTKRDLLPFAFICNGLDLRFQPSSWKAATGHSSHGGSPIIPAVRGMPKSESDQWLEPRHFHLTPYFSRRVPGIAAQSKGCGRNTAR